MSKFDETKKLTSSKGQAILFAVVAVTVALAIGVTVASRSISSSSRVSKTDSSSRAYAAAEGGIERFLLLSDSALSNLSSNVNPDCAGAGFQNGSNDTSGRKRCKVTYPPVTPDNIASYAEVRVDSFTYNDDANSYYDLTINNGFTKEISLYSTNPASIRICWRNPKVALYYYSYNRTNVLKGALYSTNTVVFPDYKYISGFGFTSTSSYGSFPYCRIVSLVSWADGLRIRALYGDTEVGIYPIGSPLPPQGYKITSVGKLQQANEASKTVVVYRSSVYMPSFFDSVIYSSEGQVN